MYTFTTSVGDNIITIETGKLARQAGGSVTVRCGDTMILATATASKEPREGIDFFPLTVDYEERLYAAGKIPGGFFRREGRPTEGAILVCRLTDRPLRPLFPKGFRNDVQVIITALSADQENYLDILSIIGASAALSISDIPFHGPVGAVRVGYVDGQFIFNPTASQMEGSLLDLRLAGRAEAVMMVEASAKEVAEDVLLEALQAGHEAMQDVIRVQAEMAEQVGKAKREIPVHELRPEVFQAVEGRLGRRIQQALDEGQDKDSRNKAIESLKTELLAELDEVFDEKEVLEAFSEAFKRGVRERILKHGIRPDGRDRRTVRPISCELELSPRAHGSGLFTRGETQVLTIATLGTPREEQMIDDLTPREAKRFLHHYNFPPFSTGETWPLRGPRRRAIGHGALAEGALVSVIPEVEQFPYTIRLVSEVLSSNGSTSMASVCGSTLALMDAGVPIKAPVAGIAMGLVKDGDNYAILTDIMGMEDALGDMDFKVAGTAEGVTALQMDIKVKGITHEIMREALARAKEARLLILDRMLETIPQPRPDLSPYAPRITTIKVDPEKIGKIIGPGGKTIRRIIEETGVKIDVEDDGSVYIASADSEGSEKAIGIIEGLTAEPEVGKIYSGRVVRTTDFGAFVEFLPGQDGLIHISQLADYRVDRVEDVVRMGDEVMVMVINVDDDGRVRLSRQAVLQGLTVSEAQELDRQSRSRSRQRQGRPGSRSIGSRARRR